MIRIGTKKILNMLGEDSLSTVDTLSDLARYRKEGFPERDIYIEVDLRLTESNSSLWKVCL